MTVPHRSDSKPGTRAQLFLKPNRELGNARAGLSLSFEQMQTSGEGTGQRPPRSNARQHGRAGRPQTSPGNRQSQDPSSNHSDFWSHLKGSLTDDPHLRLHIARFPISSGRHLSMWSPFVKASKSQTQWRSQTKMLL